MTLKLTTPEVPVQLRPAEHLNPQDVQWIDRIPNSVYDLTASIHSYIDYGIASGDTSALHHADLLTGSVLFQSNPIAKMLNEPVRAYLPLFTARAEGVNAGEVEKKHLYWAGRSALDQLVDVAGNLHDETNRDQAALWAGLMLVDSAYPGLRREADSEPTMNHTMYTIDKIGDELKKTPLIADYSETAKSPIAERSTVHRLHIADTAAEVLAHVPGPHQELLHRDARHGSRDPAVRADAAFVALSYGLKVQLNASLRKPPHETFIQQVRRVLAQEVDHIKQNEA